jgi:ABC-type multidrug transport system fused ATPase/permease subunit
MNFVEDAILVLDQGRIVEHAHRSETHSAHELFIEQEGLQTSLYQTQFQDAGPCTANPTPAINTI